MGRAPVVLLALVCAAASARSAPASNVVRHVAGAGSFPRLRGGSNNIDLDAFCAIDPTRIAGVGVGFKKDKVRECARVPRLFPPYQGGACAENPRYIFRVSS